jgi:hypothetical protein
MNRRPDRGLKFDPEMLFGAAMSAGSATAGSSLAAFQRLPIVQPAHSLSASD